MPILSRRTVAALAALCWLLAAPGFAVPGYAFPRQRQSTSHEKFRRDWLGSGNTPHRGKRRNKTPPTDQGFRDKAVGELA